MVDPATSRRVSIGTFRTKAEAEVALAAAISDQQRGAWVGPEKGRATLADYAWRWLETRLTPRGEPLRPKTHELYEAFLRLHILPTLGDVPLGRLTTITIRAWHAELLAHG
ncbi:MAG: N-terminal phage integrase SAM-like domain-containing protein, partial [Actinomycetota bacterium]|nr:N-terminal phage integrase SAM-like domain-containing protein [Actinomycetota bacterium]